MANEWYQNNMNNMRGYQNINKTGTQAWPEYDENYGSKFAGVGRFDPRNLMRPDNLTRDTGASMYQAPPVGNYESTSFLPDQGNVTYAPEEKQSIFSRLKGLKTPLMKILQSQKNNPEENFGLKNFPTNNGRVAYHPNDSLYAGMNVATGFGAGLSGAGDKRLARIQKTITGLEEEDGGNWSNLKKNQPEEFAKKLRFHQEKLKRMTAESEAYKRDLALQTGQGGTTIVPPDTGGTTYGGPPTKSWDPVQHAKSGGGHYKGAGTSGSYAAGPQGGTGYGPWSKRDGGRIGYAGGELVDEDINIQGPGFDVNENMEMAEGPSPFEMRIQELVDTGMSWQEAYQIAAEEFGMAEGQEDSFNEEGIASLV